MKSLLPSLKEKKRYIVFEVINLQGTSNPLNQIVNQIRSFLGMIGSAEAGLMPVDYKQGKGIIKVNNKYVDKVKSSLLFINEVGIQKVAIRSLGVSGMINKARNYM